MTALFFVVMSKFMSGNQTGARMAITMTLDITGSCCTWSLLNRSIQPIALPSKQLEYRFRYLPSTGKHLHLSRTVPIP
jgi:hypothetical protein